MYVCIYVCMYVCLDVCMYVCTYIYIHECIRTCIHMLHMHTNMLRTCSLCSMHAFTHEQINKIFHLCAICIELSCLHAVAAYRDSLYMCYGHVSEH